MPVDAEKFSAKLQEVGTLVKYDEIKTLIVITKLNDLEVLEINVRKNVECTRE